VIAFLVIYPLSILVVESFKIASERAVGASIITWNFSRTRTILKPSATPCCLSTLVLLTTTVFGVPLAYILARYRHRGKTVFTALILLPIVLPAFAGVFAFIIFFGKYGTVNLLLMDLGLIEKPFNFIYGIHGLVFVQSLHMLPFIVLGLSAGFTNIDPSFEEAAEVEGASGFRRFITITLAALHTELSGGRGARIPVAVHRLADALDPRAGGFSAVGFLYQHRLSFYGRAPQIHGDRGGGPFRDRLHSLFSARQVVGRTQKVYRPLQRNDV
jgi:ABC-type Fe3+ transport system permease subunit